MSETHLQVQSSVYYRKGTVCLSVWLTDRMLPVTVQNSHMVAGERKAGKGGRTEGGSDESTDGSDIAKWSWFGTRSSSPKVKTHNSNVSQSRLGLGAAHGFCETSARI
ncbi:hypothetical protein JOB18_005938 [Solea senegalensis]|uniref:Uncharacterized protein n=1 Tax=Solea senegalensis TaxID=28829 RepID=A0AAV6QGD0_SOLSE|nr:hypothetical protein JOB18_005938 [Solea senegalensis]